MAGNATAKTLQEIASLLVQPSTAEDTATTSPNEGNVDTAEEETVHSEADDANEADDTSNGDEADDAPQTEGDDEDDAGNDDAEEELDDDGYLTVNDDDLIEVKIDGEIVLRSIADAKKALSLQGATEKRLKEATELRKTAQADHTMLLEQFSVAHRNLMNTVQGLEEIVFKPMVQKPDPALRQTNPQQYLLQVDAYEADQRRVEEGKKQIRSLIDRQQEALKKDIQKYRQQQATELTKHIPVLTDAEKAPKVLQGMSKLAMEVYGYSPEEIQQASDHRMYRMMYDLMKFHEARSTSPKKAEKVADISDQANKRPRKLRSGATSLKSRATAQAKAAQATAEKARQTGKVKDVAATLVTKATRNAR